MKRDLLTIDEVAEDLAISAEAARQLCVTGKLAFVLVTVGQQRQTRRVRRDTLEAFKRNEQRAGVREEVKNVRETLAAMASVEERW